MNSFDTFTFMVGMTNRTERSRYIHVGMTLIDIFFLLCPRLLPAQTYNLTYNQVVKQAFSVNAFGTFTFLVEMTLIDIHVLLCPGYCRHRLKISLRNRHSFV